MARLGDVCFKITDGSHNPPQGVSASEYLMLSSKNIFDDVITFDDPRYLSKEDFELENKRTQIATGDILMTIVGTVGRAAVVPDLAHNICLQRSVAVLKPKSEIVLPRFLMYQLQSMRTKMEKEAKGVAQKGIYLKQVEDLPIRVLSMDEQTGIVSSLDKVSNLLSFRKQQLAKLDELVKSRFIELFGDPETNPFGWEKVTVGEVCSSIVRGPFGSALKKEFFVEPNETTYKVYEQKHAIQKSATIGTYYVTAEKFDELRRFECVAGDILMSCSGTMGELYQLPEGCEKGLINQALCKFTLNEKILPIVFLTYMKQTIGNLETKGSGIQNIAAVSYVKAMPINLAPMEVQKQFVAFVEQVDKSKLVVQQSIDQLETLKKSLMQKYFG